MDPKPVELLSRVRAAIESEEATGKREELQSKLKSLEYELNELARLDQKAGSTEVALNKALLSDAPRMSWRDWIRSRKRPQVWRINGGIGLSAFVVSLCILFIEPPPSQLRNFWLLCNGLLWAGFVITFPLAAINTGVLYTKYGESSRSKEPARFWVGLVTYSILLSLILVVVLVVSYEAWATYAM